MLVNVSLASVVEEGRGLVCRSSVVRLGEAQVLYRNPTCVRLATQQGLGLQAGWLGADAQTSAQTEPLRRLAFD